MSGKGLRRLDLWLPESHPVFKYPPGTRAKVAREWLDIGARLAGVERKLEELREKLENGVPPAGQEKNGDLPFDPAVFGKTLVDVFG